MDNELYLWTVIDLNAVSYFLWLIWRYWSKVSFVSYTQQRVSSANVQWKVAAGALEMVSVGPEKNKLILYRILPIAIKAVDNFELFG